MIISNFLNLCINLSVSRYLILQLVLILLTTFYLITEIHVFEYYMIYFIYLNNKFGKNIKNNHYLSLGYLFFYIIDELIAHNILNFVNFIMLFLMTKKNTNNNNCYLDIKSNKLWYASFFISYFNYSIKRSNVLYTMCIYFNVIILTLLKTINYSNFNVSDLMTEFIDIQFSFIFIQHLYKFNKIECNVKNFDFFNFLLNVYLVSTIPDSEYSVYQNNNDVIQVYDDNDMVNENNLDDDNNIKNMFNGYLLEN